MNDPIAYFLTITTYGTWLPGDERGWTEYHRGWQLPDVDKEIQAAQSMTSNPCVLTQKQRIAVEEQVMETCVHRHWALHALACRTNHLHVVISAENTSPRKIRSDLKAWCTRKLRQEFDSHRSEWWTERGSVRWIFDDDSLDRAIYYVNEAQDRKHLDFSTTRHPSPKRK
ncbi:MAG: transposase [Pirellulaceae bacterium]